VPPNSKAHNIVIGRTWVDSSGDFYVYNATTGSKCVLRFTPCGWFSYGRYEFTGHICDKDGNKKILLSGGHCCLPCCRLLGWLLGSCWAALGCGLAAAGCGLAAACCWGSAGVRWGEWRRSGGCCACAGAQPRSGCQGATSRARLSSPPAEASCGLLRAP
jgi:hypothetical protein